MKKKRAFTIVEILIIVIILGILAAIIIPQFQAEKPAPKPTADDSTTAIDKPTAMAAGPATRPTTGPAVVP